MKQAAAIMGSLVDVRNVGTHKCVKLTIHVPAEHAPKVFECFGWPTGVDPVPVALARLKPESEVVQDQSSERHKTLPRSADDSPLPGGAKKSWHDMPLSQQAGVLCNEKSFWRFLAETNNNTVTDDSESAARAVRGFCQVNSRADIGKDEFSRRAWITLVSNYRAWIREPEVIGT